MSDRRAEALERLAAWERDAKAAPAGPWVATGAGEVSCPRGLIIENPCSSLDSPDCHHIANFGPDVALRLIEGLRAVLDAHPLHPTDDDPTKFGCLICDYDGDCSWQHESDHPDGCDTARAVMRAILGSDE